MVDENNQGKKKIRGTTYKNLINGRLREYNTKWGTLTVQTQANPGNATIVTEVYLKGQLVPGKTKITPYSDIIDPKKTAMQSYLDVVKGILDAQHEEYERQIDTGEFFKKKEGNGNGNGNGSKPVISQQNSLESKVTQVVPVLKEEIEEKIVENRENQLEKVLGGKYEKLPYKNSSYAVKTYFEELIIEKDGKELEEFLLLSSVFYLNNNGSREAVHLEESNLNYNPRKFLGVAEADMLSLHGKMIEQVRNGHFHEVYSLKKLADVQSKSKTGDSVMFDFNFGEDITQTKH
jgi:hypothetical protein